MDQPDPERREERPQANGLGLGGHRRRVGEQLARLRVRLGLVDERDDDEGSVAECRLGPDPLPRRPELVRATDPRPDRDPSFGRGPQVGHVQVRIEDLAERSRDRCRRHQQHVWRVAARLCLELTALLDPEPVLLVDDDDAERCERDAVLDQRMRPDHDRRHAAGQEVERMAGRRG